MNLGEDMQRRAERVCLALRRGARGNRPRHRRPRRDRPRRADLPVRRRALPARRRARPGQDAAGAHAGQDARPGLLAHPVHARPDAGRHPRHEHGDGDRPTASGSSSSSAGRSSRRSAWPTKSTAPRPRRSRPCSKRCRKARSPSAARSTSSKQPFFVMATQNPIEQEGTYPLPEAQLDRFFFKLVVGYSSREELATILDRTTRGEHDRSRQGDGRRRDPPAGSS